MHAQTPRHGCHPRPALFNRPAPPAAPFCCAHTSKSSRKRSRSAPRASTATRPIHSSWVRPTSGLRAHTRKRRCPRRPGSGTTPRNVSRSMVLDCPPERACRAFVQRPRSRSASVVAGRSGCVALGPSQLSNRRTRFAKRARAMLSSRLDSTARAALTVPPTTMPMPPLPANPPPLLPPLLHRPDRHQSSPSQLDAPPMLPLLGLYAFLRKPVVNGATSNSNLSTPARGKKLVGGNFFFFLAFSN